MSVCSPLLIVKVIFVTTLFLCVFSTFLVNKDDQYTNHSTEFAQHEQWQCCHHRHFVKDSHDIIIYRKKVCSLRQQNYLNYPTFTEYLLLFQWFPACCYVAKLRQSSCGAPFCGAPVRPNMLSMPKSACTDYTCGSEGSDNCLIHSV